MKNLTTNSKQDKPGKGNNHWNWQGGKGFYYHENARKMHDDSKCSECGISIEEYKDRYDYINKFDMHCLMKDFRTKKKEDWVVVCRECHSKIHQGLNTINKKKKGTMLDIQYAS